MVDPNERASPSPTAPPVHIAMERAAAVCSVVMIALLLCMLPRSAARMPLFAINSMFGLALLILGVSAGGARLVSRSKGGHSTARAAGRSVLWVLAAPFLWVLSLLALFEGMSGSFPVGG